MTTPAATITDAASLTRERLNDSDTRDLIDLVVEEADQAFWAVVAERFPQVRSSDLSPVDTMVRDGHNAADLMTWLRDNLRYTATPRAQIAGDGDITCLACGNTAVEDGFSTVTERQYAPEGRVVVRETEPTPAAWPLPLYRCDRCRAVYLVPVDANGTTVTGVRP